MAAASRSTASIAAATSLAPGDVTVVAGAAAPVEEKRAGEGSSCEASSGAGGLSEEAASASIWLPDREFSVEWNRNDVTGTRR